MAGLLSKLFGIGAAPRALDESAWQGVLQSPVFDGLQPDDFARLRELVQKLLADKAINGAGGIEVDDDMATVIAAFATLPILNLGYGWYEGWNEIVVYPGEFQYDGEEVDEAGVVHPVRHVRSGEAWEGGPMVLSWQDVEWSGHGEGFNVVIHEFAHKLDMRSGSPNGRPPLHSGMDAEAWARDLQAAYEDFCRRVDCGEDTVIDPYAAESPAEFFAVLTEYFFDAPDLLHEAYPAVYAQLKSFYMQDPLARWQSSEARA